MPTQTNLPHATDLSRPLTPAAQHLLFVLLDSNLPTGGFVASGGLESYAKHGFLRTQPQDPYSKQHTLASEADAGRFGNDGSARAGPASAGVLGPAKVGPAIVDFARAEMENFDASTGGYLVQAWEVVEGVLRGDDCDGRHGLKGCDAVGGGERIAAAVAAICALDAAHESTLLSHVARRASKAQGIAILTLHGRGMGVPPGFEEEEYGGEGGAEQEELEEVAKEIVGEYRRAIRKGSAPGHLAVCFGVMAAALGLDLHTTHHLYLFTHARSTLSAGVRLNLIGPYLSTQLLAHPMRRLIDETMASTANEPSDSDARNDPFWEWADEAERGPATTWPLGEILAGRHDLQHSRIFNS